MISSQAATHITCLVTAVIALVVALSTSSTMVRMICVGVTVEALINAVVLLVVDYINKKGDSND